jgi:hypothetical protein
MLAVIIRPNFHPYHKVWKSWADQPNEARGGDKKQLKSSPEETYKVNWDASVDIVNGRME